MSRCLRIQLYCEQKDKVLYLLTEVISTDNHRFLFPVCPAYLPPFFFLDRAGAQLTPLSNSPPFRLLPLLPTKDHGGGHQGPATRPGTSGSPATDHSFSPQIQAETWCDLLRTKSSIHPHRILPCCSLAA